MKLIVNAHKIEIDKSPVNEREIDISKCEFEFADEITNDYVKEAYFTFKGTTYKQIIINNECSFPSEVLTEKGTVEIGVVAYKVEDEETIKRYNPSPAYFNTWDGSLKDNAENSEPITPTDKEQIEQMLSNINIDGSKTGKITTITITYKDGTTKEVQLEDGMGLDYIWQGTSLGIKREDETEYQFVNLQGEKGEPGAIKMQIVAELPQTGSDDTIYLVPLENPDIQGNNYAEYVYINGAWELLGKIGVQINLTNYYTKQETYSKDEVDNLIPDLTDYVKNTDYANGTTAGVVKIDTNYNGVNVGSSGFIFPSSINYATYQSKDNNYFISKGTLENVITGKGLVNNTDYATSNKGGVIKSGGYGINVESDGLLSSTVLTHTQYGNASNKYNVSKGTLENVLNARIGDIDSVLDSINGEVI